MLVITRKSQEKVVLPTYGITITVLKARRGRVRLGIEAPKNVTILRAELLERNRGQKPSADETGSEPQPGQSDDQPQTDACETGASGS